MIPSFPSSSFVIVYKRRAFQCKRVFTRLVIYLSSSVNACSEKEEPAQPGHFYHYAHQNTNTRVGLTCHEEESEARHLLGS